MWADLGLQAAVVLIPLFFYLFTQNIPQSLFKKLHLFTRRSHLQAKRHFVAGAQLLSQAASDPSLATRSEAEADRAISLDPTDAASHILKALALEIQGFRTSALNSLDAALSPLAVKSLSAAEKADALFKRAELRAALGGGGGGAVVEDLTESVRLKGDNAKAYGLLGECLEKNGLNDQARKAFEDALRVRPDYDPARVALARLVSKS